MDRPGGQQMARLQVSRKTLGCEALHEVSEKGWDGRLVQDADAKDVDEQRDRGRRPEHRDLKQARRFARK